MVCCLRRIDVWSTYVRRYFQLSTDNKKNNNKNNKKKKEKSKKKHTPKKRIAEKKYMKNWKTGERPVLFLRGKILQSASFDKEKTTSSNMATTLVLLNELTGFAHLTSESGVQREPWPIRREIPPCKLKVLVVVISNSTITTTNTNNKDQQSIRNNRMTICEKKM